MHKTICSINGGTPTDSTPPRDRGLPLPRRRIGLTLNRPDPYNLRSQNFKPEVFMRGFCLGVLILFLAARVSLVGAEKAAATDWSFNATIIQGGRWIGGADVRPFRDAGAAGGNQGNCRPYFSGKVEFVHGRSGRKDEQIASMLSETG
jgi:hypothetical protein